MEKPFILEANIPRGSGDAEWQIIHRDTRIVVATIDPNMCIDEPCEYAHKICDAMNDDERTHF